MRKLLVVLLVAVLLPAADAWGEAQSAGVATARSKKVQKCTYPKSKRRAPGWVCHGHVEGLALTAVGSAPKSRAGFSFMEKMAAADARAHLVQAVSETVQRKLDAGAANGKPGGRDDALLTRIAEATLQNTRIEKHSYGSNGALYVLVGLDSADADRLIESVTAEYLRQRK